MQIKRLKPNPIIPAELYIIRDADRQVRRIVEDMGRPGYVLVARQMGKTNLLLNAKRELERSDDCFLYLDVSNIFPNITSFLRSIIDTALDTYPEKLGSVAQAILQRRLTAGLPHKEHELELRDLLRAIQGKIIICLDEIDALTKTEYSDQVFSFLRSIYFSGRINFPEFNRLTYILSGVAEPSALIKNRDVSPFNIGEKIFLEDFSISEFTSFVEKAELGFSPEVVDRIYHWMHGNPRMTWDICSKLEDMKNAENEITEFIVDQSIRQLYFSSYDVPPIDHLRTLAEDDKEIRQSLMSLHYGKGASITDAIKSRLYLHGFIRIGNNDQPICIKNLVIEEALSESWLQDIEQSKTSLLERAEKRIKERAFNEALALFEEYLKSANANDGADLRSVHFSMGRCCLDIGLYPDAILHFNQSLYERSEYPKAFIATNYYIGVCHHNLKQIEDATKHLDKVISECEKTNIHAYHYDACIAMSSINLTTRNYAKVIELTDSIISEESEVRKVNTDEKHANELIFAAHYNASLAEENLNNLIRAKSHLIQVLALSDKNVKAGILLRLSRLENIEIDKRDYLNKGVQEILDGRLAIVKAKIDRPLDLNTENVLGLLSRLVESKDMKSLNHLLDHIFDDGMQHSVPLYNIVSTAVYGANSDSDRRVAEILVDRALLVDPHKMDVKNRRDLLTFALILYPFELIENVKKMYFEEYLNVEGAFLVETDYRLAFGLTNSYLDKSNIEKARSVLHRFRELMSAENSFTSESCVLIIEFLEIICNIHAGQNISMLPKVKEFVERIQVSKIGPRPRYFKEGIIADLRSQLVYWIRSQNQSKSFRRTSQKIGRNDRVEVQFKDGAIIVDKFKNLERQIVAGECELLNVAQ